MDNKSRGLSTSDMRILRTVLGRYAARYHLAGPEKDDLIERTFQVLASNPEIFFEIPVEQAAADNGPDLRRPLALKLSQLFWLLRPADLRARITT